VVASAQGRALLTGVGDHPVQFLVVLRCRALDRVVVRQREVLGQSGDGVEDTGLEVNRNGNRR
jgi:hypothetical protein